MSVPVAYLLTWTCYGTWLHGDERGSVDDDHNRFNWPFVAADPAYLDLSKARLLHPPIKLDADRRRVVHDTITAHAAIRSWKLHAIHVRTNHVHAVCDTQPTDPGRAVGQFKAWSTRRLREADLIAPLSNVWTKQSSTRYLWNSDSLARAISYVQNDQGEALP